MDSLEGMSDLFVKCWPEGCSPQTTDTHWRCKKGKASFNYRLIFGQSLGVSYLVIVVWLCDVVPSPIFYFPSTTASSSVRGCFCCDVVSSSFFLHPPSYILPCFCFYLTHPHQTWSWATTHGL
jgi:hypothetical protein